MAQRADLLVPLAALDWQDEAVVLAAPGETGPDALAVMLMQVVQGFAGRAAGESAAVSPVSVTLDTTGAPGAGDPVRFEAGLDRRTRTLVFAHGRAVQAGDTLLTLTGVYRIGS